MLAPNQKSSQIVEIERLGLAWHEEAQYPIEPLTEDMRVQVRESEHYAPAQQVRQYAVQMGETQFPPIIVTRNGYLVDGNTRKRAKDQRKEKFIAAIVLDVDFGKNPKTDNQLRALAATLNQQGGQRLTVPEAREVVRTFIDLGWKPEQINRAIGIKSSTVSQVKKEMAAEAKFQKVGFADEAKLPAAIKRAFGTAEMVAMNDVPYLRLVKLALDANLSTTEVNDLAKEMKSIGSDSGMINFAEAKRMEMADRIREHNLEGNGKPSKSSQLRRVLGFILNAEGDIRTMVEKVPAAMEDHLRIVKKAAELLQEVASAQEVAIDNA